MRTRTWAIVAALIVCVCGAARPSAAQDDDDGPAITARVRATFVDDAGGLGVLSGDLAIARFEVRNGALTAIARIVGALADASGNVLGPVSQEVAVGVSNVGSTCNQLRMELAEIDADVLGRRVRFDGQTAGFDSREGTTPKAMSVLCSASELLRSKPAPAALAHALDQIAATIRAARPR